MISCTASANFSAWERQLIGCGHMQGKQMAQRIHRRMYLRSLTTFGAVVACARTRFRRGLQVTAIQDHGRRLTLAPGKLTE